MQYDYLYDEEYIPGTESVVADEERLAGQFNIKRRGDLILIPQPSDSPNDPLNWGYWRKVWQFFLLMCVTGLTAATANDAGAGQNGMHEELGISWDSMNVAAGVLFIGIAFSTLLLSPTSFLYGRKISYLICITVGLFGNLWFAKVQNTQDSIWCQLLVGISESCAESQVQLSLSDVFFRHQLGSYLAVYILATSIGTYLGPLIAGYFADGPGWRWIGWSGVIASGILLLALLFSHEETYFDRNAESPITPSVSHDDEKDGQSDEGVETLANPPKTYWQNIAIITPATNIQGFGFKQYLKRLWLQLRVFTFPAVIYSGLQWGAQDAWLTFYMTTQDEDWSLSPWNYSDAGVAIMNVPTLIGALIGCIYGGVLSDKFSEFMARRNGGIREPETRLWLMGLTAIIAPIGMFLFGVGTARYWSWPVPYVGLGFIGFGWGCAGDLSMAYLMDCYPEMVLEGMVGVAFINNMIGCIFTFACSPWIDAQGNFKTYIAIGILEFVFMVLTIPMIYYGKESRRWTKKSYVKFLESRDSIQSPSARHSERS
ncbi:hypothetical protein TRICI_006822 [Trichomonascus ciferrii]|uniref:Major facilitator superfamily (MFS) profile domain-containing protein n=1 Tax=Trichomonascus ciferrii TaxID=44093 RepID=A0A642UJZ7_9ASCO|nr:hypothetical protein TRICI_006822 [Trichomonascus ciferrii]